MYVFLDTEFTGLDQSNPGLISMGLVDGDSGATFYAELPAVDWQATVSAWAKTNVVPLLQGGPAIVQREALPAHLAGWLASLGERRIVTDSPEYDFMFLQAVLRDQWPASLARQCLRFDSLTLGTALRDDLLAVRAAALPEGCGHHALHDARALCAMWLYATQLPDFYVWARRVGVS